MRRPLLALFAGLSVLTAAIVAQRPPASSAGRHRMAPLRRRCREFEVYRLWSRWTLSNVARLAVAWRWSTPDNDIVKTNPARPYGNQDTPLMVNGVLYTTTPLGIVAALDPVSGRTLWTSELRAPERTGRPTKPRSRTVAPPLDRRHAQAHHHRHPRRAARSIDAETGTPGDFGTAGRVSVTDGLAYTQPLNYAMNSSPVVVRNVVIPSTNIAESSAAEGATARRHLRLDARTGKKLWTFHAIPARGEFGYDTSGRRLRPRSTGNTNVWSLITVDEETGYVYLPLRTPTNDFSGGHRPGRQPLRREPRLPRRHHREARVALPGCASRPVGLRLPRGAESRRPRRERTSGEGRGAGQQAGVHLRVRPADRPATVADRGAAIAGVPTVPGERAARTQPFPTLPPPFEQQGSSTATSSTSRPSCAHRRSRR